MSVCVFSIEEDDVHMADGNVVEAVIAPITVLDEKKTYISYAFCEEHLWPGHLPPGRYNVVLHIMGDDGPNV